MKISSNKKAAIKAYAYTIEIDYISLYVYIDDSRIDDKIEVLAYTS